MVLKRSRGERVDKEQRSAFHGIIDAMSEWNRMRELGWGGPATRPGNRR